METPNDILYYTYTPTPVGKILLTACANQLTGLYLEGQKNCPVIQNQWQYHRTLPIFQEMESQLNGYFNLERSLFTIDYTLHGTDFQKNIWQSLAKIPYGNVLSYKAFAALAAYPNGTRAVASAIGKNPLSILLPCHRVIRSDRSLGGYAAGLAVKKQLLALEQME